MPNINSKLREVTLVFLIDQNRILLALKKRGFGVDLWNGVGGKKNPDETIIQAARREAYEEIGVILGKLNKVAILNFYIDNKHKEHELNQKAHVYITKTWKNNPEESEEMFPKWFSFKDIPYDQMWPDDKYWLPMILENKKIEGDFILSEEGKLISHDIKSLSH